MRYVGFAKQLLYAGFMIGGVTSVAFATLNLSFRDTFAETNIDEDRLVRVTVIGKREDALAIELFETSKYTVPSNVNVEWYRHPGESPKGDFMYPILDHSAAYLCSVRRCSLPIANVEKLKSKIIEMGKAGLNAHSN